MPASFSSVYNDTFNIEFSTLLAESFKRQTGRALLPAAYPDTQSFAHALYHAPFALVAHGTQADPIFCYANRTAQQLWGYDWERFTALPSRLSAEAAVREERQHLLARALEQGVVTDYRGIRVAHNGTRFEIRDAVLWNVIDAQGLLHGQAAMFEHWHVMEPL